MPAAAIATAAIDLSGAWCDQSHQCNINVKQSGMTVDVFINNEHRAAGAVSDPAGVRENARIDLTFAAGNIKSLGVFPPTTPDFSNITWIDPPDAKAHNSWCKQAYCRFPTPPPGPPPGPPPRVYPFDMLNGGSNSGAEVPDSPDPIITYVWANNYSKSKTLQLFTQLPKRVLSATDGAFDNTASLTSKNASVAVKGTGSIAGN
jgi:hypothetical protein